MHSGAAGRQDRRRLSAVIWAVLPLVVAGGLSGCIDVPELDRSQDPSLANAPYPALIPLEPVLAGRGDPAEQADEEEAGLAARVAALNAQASALAAQPVLDPADKARLTSAAAD